MGTPTQLFGSDGYAYLVVWIGWVRLLSCLDQIGTPTQYLCDYGSGWVRLPKFVCGPALILVLQLVGPLGACVKSKADRAQSSRAPVPLPEDPHEAIRQAYLNRTDTEFEPFEDPIDTETLESPLTIAPPTSLSESTPPVLVPILRRTARMAVRAPPTMSSGLSASIAKVAAMFESAFRKRFRSSYESSPYVSPPDLPLRKRYRGTSELVEDSEEDEDEELEEIMDSDSVSEDAEDDGPTTEEEDPATRDEGLAAGSRACVESDGLGLEKEEEAVPGALRRRELALEEDYVYSTFEVGQGSGSAPESERPKRVSTSTQPTLTTWTDPEDAGSSSRDAGGLIRDHAIRLKELSPALFERYDRDIGELLTRSRVVRDGIFFQSPGVVGWSDDAQRASLWHVISDMQGENWDLRLQLAEKRRVRLELDEVVDSIRRGQEPRGDA
ncbi:hypothetical protein Tco_0289772 [Tanacetum coccineum]